MTTRFGLSGATLGVVAGVSVGLAGLIGWQYLRPVPAPVPPLAQIPGLLAAPVLPLMGQPPAATPGLTADGPPLPSLGPAPASGVAAPGADSPTEADHSLAAVPEVPDPILRDAAVRDAATGKAVTPAPAGPALQGQTADTLPEIPRFDTFRLGQDGTAVLAGIAAGAEEVVVLVDAVEVARTRPTANGRFAALFTLDPASTPRMLSLRALGLAGGEVASTESILLPPRIGDIAAVVGAVPRAGSDATTSAALGEMVRVREAPPPLAAADLPGGADPAGGTGRVAAPKEAGGETVAALPMAGAAATTGAQRQAQEIHPRAPALETAAAPTPGAPAALLLTEDGARKLGAPSDGGLAIDTITYAESGAVSVAGRGLAGLALRLYLDNAPKLDTLIDPEGHWQGELSDVRPGLYTLRADQMDGGGKVLARSETPFLREAPEALAAVAADPALGSGATPVAQVVTVQPGYTLWGIAKTTYGSGMSYVQVFEANRGQIRNPDLIYPGQIFTLPRPD